MLGSVSEAEAARAELADSLSMALLVLLERLTPVERAAYRPRRRAGQLPGGGDAVGWEVDIDLLLTREDVDAEG